jgi:hypothetical protein
MGIEMSHHLPGTWKPGNLTFQEATLKNLALTKLTMFQYLTTPLLALSCLITFSIITIGPTYAAEDAYLRALKDESGGNSSSSTTSSKSGDSYLDTLSDEAESSAQVHSGEQHDETYYENQKKMVEMLRLERPSTYKFYTKLTPKNQVRVFEKYNADESDTGDRLSHMQKHIMDIYFKK